MAMALWDPTIPEPEGWRIGDPWPDTLPHLVIGTDNGAGPGPGLPQSPGVTPQPAAAGQFGPMFDLDFYNRLHLSISVLALGNVVGQQQRIVSVWNAYSYGVTLESVVLANGEGIEVAGQGLPPTAFVPLQERSWVIRVSPEGPPTIDATVTWSFDTGTSLQLSITGNRVSPWTWRPDWGRGIGEALEWATDVLEAEEGDEQRIGRRLTPRQTWTFTATAEGVARQAMEAAIAGWGGRVWALPLWPHASQIKSIALAGATVLQAAGFDREFMAGGLALIMGEDAMVSEVVEIEEVQADQLLLRRGLNRQWPAGSTVYPAKSARMIDSVATRFTGTVADAAVTFTVASANPHASIDPATLPQHRGFGVLEERPDWTGAPQLTSLRRLAISDNSAGVPSWVDRAGYPTLRQVIRYAPLGRAQVERMRQVQYYLAGQLRALWIPSYASDFQLKTLAAEGASNIDVAYVGYTAYLRNQVGRTDIRIQTRQGIQYRQITGSTDLGNGMERLGLGAPLAMQLDPSEGVEISFLSLMRGNSDRVEWAWWSGDMEGDNVHADTILPMRTFRNEF